MAASRHSVRTGHSAQNDFARAMSPMSSEKKRSVSEAAPLRQRASTRQRSSVSLVVSRMTNISGSYGRGALLDEWADKDESEGGRCGPEIQRGRRGAPAAWVSRLRWWAL